MNLNILFKNIKQKESFLCVGLDSCKSKMPKHLLGDPNPVLSFNKAIINSTHHLCVAYKLNLAFYENLGKEGYYILEETLKCIPNNILVIADAKRGDIGNTSEEYAQAFFEKLNFDAITLSPYMGKDTVTPFLKYDNKWSVILALTSNKSASDFQFIKDADGNYLFERVLQEGKRWGTNNNTMFVVGATKSEYIKRVRKIAPNHFLLVPGIGKQGGSLNDVCEIGLNSTCGLLVNSSRGIIYASSDENFAQAAKEEAIKLQREMKRHLKNANLL